MNNLINFLADYAMYIFGVLGAAAFLVSLIVQLTKELPGIKHIPTKLYVIIVSIFICDIFLLFAVGQIGILFEWYYIVLIIPAAFVIAYISIFGWDTLKELWDRYTKIN